MMGVRAALATIRALSGNRERERIKAAIQSIPPYEDGRISKGLALHACERDG